MQHRSQIQATAVFYPFFYPRRRHGEDKTTSFLVTIANQNGRPERGSSLPSWS